MEAAIDSPKHENRSDQPRLSAWLWKPWYAKLWWTAIPIWWVSMAASAKIDFLAGFYSSAFAGFLNILFFPMTALMVLGVGYARERLDSFVGQREGIPLTDEEASAVTNRVWEEHNRLMENIGRGTDMFDPRSGPLWIGNATNPNNGAYINPNTGRHS